MQSPVNLANEVRSLVNLAFIVSSLFRLTFLRTIHSVGYLCIQTKRRIIFIFIYRTKIVTITKQFINLFASTRFSVNYHKYTNNIRNNNDYNNNNNSLIHFVLLNSLSITVITISSRCTTRVVWIKCNSYSIIIDYHNMQLLGK